MLVFKRPVPIRGRLPRRTHMSFGNNWIGHEGFKGTVGYPFGVIAHYKFNENTAGDNAELVVGGTFTDWTGDNPDGWTVIGEVGSDPEISEVGTGEGHGGVGTGMCNLYTSDGTSILIKQTVSLIIGRKYRVSVNIDTAIAGTLRVADNVNFQWPNMHYSTVGIHTFTFVATVTSTELRLQRQATTGITDLTFDDISIKLLAVEDSSGNDHDGLAQQDTSAISVAGKINTAFDFNGSSDFIEIADHDDFTPALTPFSVSAWVYMHDATNFPIVNKGTSVAEGEWRFRVQGNDYLEIIFIDDSEADNIGRKYESALPENQWLHVVGTYDGGTVNAGIKLYLDAVQVDDADSDWGAAWASVENLGANIEIGKERFNYANGLIDNVMFWNRVLSAYEISRRFAERHQAYRRRRHYYH